MHSRYVRPTTKDRKGRCVGSTGRHPRAHVHAVRNLLARADGMPVLDGAGFLLAMRNTETHREIPCIVVSSMPERNVRARIDGYAASVRAEVVRLIATILGVSQQPPEDSA